MLCTQEQYYKAVDKLDALIDHPESDKSMMEKVLHLHTIVSQYEEKYLRGTPLYLVMQFHWVNISLASIAKWDCNE